MHTVDDALTGEVHLPKMICTCWCARFHLHRHPLGKVDIQENPRSIGLNCSALVPARTFTCSMSCTTYIIARNFFRYRSCPTEPTTTTTYEVHMRAYGFRNATTGNVHMKRE